MGFAIGNHPSLIFIISGGVLTFIILFIFAKRQITRFALRSRRGPHVPIGADAKKCLKKEIERRIEAVPCIMYEPRLLSNEPSDYILASHHPYHYRFKAVDDAKTLEEEIARQYPGLRRHPRESLRSFLLRLLAAPLDGCGLRLVHQYCDAYDCARYHPAEFGDDEYHAYSRLLLKLIDATRLLKSVGVCRAGRDSPARGAAARRGAGADRYTALENLPADTLEEEVAERPAPPADETAV